MKAARRSVGLDLAVFCACAWAARGGAEEGGCKVSITGQGKDARIVLENEFLRAVIAPNPDIGFIRELTYKPTGRQLSAYEHFSKRGGEGAAMDRMNFGYLWQQSKDYAYEISKQAPEEVVVSLSYV